MKFRKRQIVGMLFLLTTLSATNLWAQTPKVWISAGAKGGVGGNYLSKPDNALTGLVAPFDDGAGGIGGGGGIYGDVRFLNQHLGFEVDLLLDANKTWCTITYSNVVDLDYIVKYTSLRIPLLFKFGTEQGITRISGGIGPEFRIGVNASPEVEVSSGEQYVTSQDLADLESSLSASKRNDVALAWELALAFRIRKIELTLDLRFTYNLTFPKDYLDRVEINPLLETINIESGHSVDGRILLGAGYIFTPGASK